MNQQFYDKYPELANVVNCIVGFPADASDKKKSEYFDLMQVLLTKLQEDETLDKATT